MNKLIKRVVLFMTIACVFTLTACSDKYVKPTIEMKIAHALRNTIDLEFVIWDIDEELVDLKITLEGKHDGEDYTDYKTVSIYGGDYEEDDETGEEVFIGEEKEYTFSNLLIDNTYEIKITGTYGEKSRNMLDEKIILTTSTKGSEEDKHEISNFDDLLTVKLDTDGYFELTNDIDCSADGVAQELSAFFTSSKKFEGDFNGAGFTISNFYQDGFDQDLGLFGYIGSNGSVYDLTVVGASFKSTRYTDVNIGALAGTNTGEITNVNLKDITITSTGPDDGKQFVGGFVGANKDGGTITNSNVDNVEINLNAPNNVRAGGFVGTNISSTKVSSITNVNVSNATVLVQVASKPSYTSDDEDVEVVLNIGGFIGDNRGAIDDATTDAAIGVYVDGTKTDANYNPDDFEIESDDYSDYDQVNRHAAISKMSLNLGGFVGANLAGSISGGITTTEEIKVEVGFLDYLRFGGFVGYNDYAANLQECRLTVSTSVEYVLVVGEDTILGGTVNNNDINYVGVIVGL